MRASKLLLLALGVEFAVAQTWVQAADRGAVKWTGRVAVDPQNGSVTGDWAGVSAAFTVSNNFTYVLAEIADSCAGGNKLGVELTGEGAVGLRVATFYTSPQVRTYVLFAAAGRLSFTGASATFVVQKLVEARFTQCGGNTSRLEFLRFGTDGAFLPPPPPAPRRLEVLGDSITSGDLVFCPTRLPNALWADDWGVSYEALLCARFGADCSTVSWGGMGLVANDVPTWTWPFFPDIYNWTAAW